MVTKACPTCSSFSIKTLKTVTVTELAELYLEGLQIDVLPYFSGVTKVTMKQCLHCDLRFFDPPCTGDPSFYEHLQKFDWYYRDDKTEYEFAKTFVSSNSSVLDVGCGKGAFRSWLPEPVHYTGLEFNDEAISKAHSRGCNVVKQSVQDHADSACERYDVVCSFQVLEHISEPAEFVTSCVKVLKPGGTLILSVPAEDSFLTLAVNNILNMPPHHVLRWSDLALCNLANREGLSLINIWHEPVTSHIRDWHTFVLAHHWFSSLSLTNLGLIDVDNNSLKSRLIRWLVGKKPIRDTLMSYVASRFPYSQNGHTVMLVAKKLHNEGLN